MTSNDSSRPPSSLMLLDADEVLATRENLTDARRTDEGPPSRIVPEMLCEELEKYLALIEAELRAMRTANRGGG